jgi:peptidoglycan/xylan/chitin deacetylase (PgdA/CDA1 family)
MELAEEDRANYISGQTKKNFYWSEPAQQETLLKANFKKLPDQNRVSYLKAQQIQLLADSGFEIGSHSMTHSLFTAGYMDESKMRFELAHSKIYLEGITGKSVNSFCFPSGYYNAHAVRIVKEAGYTSVCLIKKNIDEEPLALHSFERIFVKPNSIDELLKSIQ